MHGMIGASAEMTRGAGVHPSILDRASSPPLGTETERDTVTILMRDGSRMSVALSNPLAQAPDLASCLAPAVARPETVTLNLNDGSQLIVSTGDIVGLHLPRSQAVETPKLGPGAPYDSGGLEVAQVGSKRVIRIRDFLPSGEAADLYRTVLARRKDFKPSAVLSNDPEYRKSEVLYQFPYYQQLFRKMLIDSVSSIAQLLEIKASSLDHFECQLTATYDKGYFKSHTDNSAKLGYRKLTYVYYFHKPSKPFTGGDIRFYDHDPFDVEQKSARHILDMSPDNNSIVFFESGCHHEVRETICSHPSFENARFTVNGWFGEPKS